MLPIDRGSNFQYRKPSVINSNHERGPVDTVYRRQTKDASTQTDSSNLIDKPNCINNSKYETHEQGNQPQTLSFSKNPISKPLLETHEQGNQPQNLGFSKSSMTQSVPKIYNQPETSSSSKKNTKSKYKNKTKSKSKHESQYLNQSISSNDSFIISPVNVPPENLLHCTFHIEGNPVTLLIDTGAGISILHRDKIGSSVLNGSDIVSIIGVSDNGQSSTRSFGSAHISLDNFPKFKFHIANLNIKVDGILGNDFMSKFNTQIYCQSKTMRIRDRTYKLYHLGENKKIDNDKVIVNKRSETVIKCSTNNLQNGTAIVNKQTIVDGIIIPSSLVNVVENNFLITCLNSSDSDKTLSIPNIEVEPFQLSYCQINNITYCSPTMKTNINRVDQVLKLVRREHLNSEESNSLDKIISNYSDIFYIEGDMLSFTNYTKHTIPTTSDVPIHTKTYRFPQIHEAEVKSQVKKMLEQDIIKPSSSPWTSPIWVVPKKLDASGKPKWRLVIDYRKLNDITVGDSYPLPNITDILDKLGHSVYFTTLDLASGFHQLEVDPKDMPKTAFSTPYGHYEFKRMPFGLKNAPATFQRTMDNILQGLQGERCFVYLDDIVVFASSLQEHEDKLREVFERLQKHQLKIQPDKCEFLRREVAYLGHIISNEGVKPSPSKVDAVQNFPIPKSCKDIKAFLGLTGYYRRFIPNFSKLTKPLTSLLKKDVTFIWGEPQQKAFEECKHILTNPPILQYPDFSKEFVLTTDASLYAIGAVLSQGEVGKDLPIAYASRTLNKAETNYSTIEREALAIIWAVKHFRPYLFGRRFKIVTDHQPLKWLFSMKDSNSRIVRWRLKLEEFDYEIIYKAGKYNVNADALSRFPVNAITNQNQLNVDDNYLQLNYEHYCSQPVTTYDTPNLSFTNDSLFDTKHKNIFIPISSKLSEHNALSTEAINLCSQTQLYLEISKELYQVDILGSNLKQKLYLGVTRPTHFDPWDSESYFKCLLSCLHNYIIDELYIPDLKNDMTCKMIGHQQYFITAFLADLYNVKIHICSNQVTTPNPQDIPQILKTYHDEPLSGHRGLNETTRKIREEFYWKGMTNDIKNYVDKCLICQRNKIQRKDFRAPMVITTQSTEPFERVSMDLVSFSDVSIDCNRYVLTLQDELTRYVQAYPIPDKEAVTIAKQLVHFCQHFGVPKRFHSDQGTEFSNQIIKQLVKFLGSSQTFNTAYHPQTNGALERFHATLREHVRMYHNRNLRNWDKIIPFAIICHNTSVNQSTGYTPYELLFGYKPRPFYSLKSIPEYTASDYVKNLNERLKIARESALKSIADMKEKAKVRYDNNIQSIVKFNIKDMVMLKVPSPNNLNPKWEGPYEITRIGFNENYVIRKSGKNLLVHANRLRPYTMPNTNPLTL